MSPYAPPLVVPKPGLPLIKSTPDLGWQLVRVKGRIDVDASLKPGTKKKKVYWAWKRFVKWQESEGLRYVGGLEIQGPFPHANLKPSDTQTGDRGATRPVARSVEDDLEPDVEDYVILANFWKRESVVMLDTDIARDLMGTRGLRPAAPRQWDEQTKRSSE